MPATPTSAISSTVLPIRRAVTAASSATGRSLVPAHTTATVPLPGVAGVCVSVMARAVSWIDRARLHGRHRF